MMRITIAEAGPAGNVGSMALIENAIHIVRRKYPDCEITVLCADPLSVREALNKDNLTGNIKVINDLFIFPHRNSLQKICWLIRSVTWILYTRILFLFFDKSIPRVLWGRKRKVLEEIAKSDYVYCIGAERINDVYFKTALFSLYALGTYIRMGKKLVHLSLTIGPVWHKTTIAVARHILDRSYAIFVRDQKSYNILRQWGCKSSHIFNVYDIAIFQKTNPVLESNLLNEFGIESGFIGVSVIDWLFHNAKGPARMPEYNKVHADILDYIIEKYEKRIVFIPTVVGANYKVHDNEAAKPIVKLMKNKDKVVSIERRMTPIELATLFSSCQFSIVTRMHAAILCSSAGMKPVIAVNYLYKLREYMKNIDFEDYSVDIDYVDTDKMKGMVDAMFENYEENRYRLNYRIEAMKCVLSEKLEEI